MTMTVRYQSLTQPLTEVSNIQDVPSDATIIWYDFENASNKSFLKISFIKVFINLFVRKKKLENRYQK